MVTFVDEIGVMKDKIIITAPIPPPIHGMSLATQMLIDGLSQYESVVIDTAMDKQVITTTLPSPFGVKRLTKIIFKLFSDSFKMMTTNYKLHYLCTGGDFRGIVRYLPYVLLSRLKRKPYVIHVHNGSFRTMYDSISKRQKRVVDFIFGNAAAVIALGDSLRYMFEGVVAKERIFVVENCVDNEFFATPDEIAQKTKREHKIVKILYLSNLMRDKGIIELMEAVSTMENCELHIAGAIENRVETANKIDTLLKKYHQKFIYHGVVSGSVKKRLLMECDLFALPSRYKIEGQPISILEAYANGLAVVTDMKCGGVKDIFRDEINGYNCESSDAKSIKEALEKSSTNLNKFIEPNYLYAKSKFKRSDFVERVNNVFSKIV